MKNPFDFSAGAEANREEALRTREMEINRRELRAQAVEKLAAEEIPAELADLIDYADAEHAAASLDTLRNGFKKAVQKAVEQRVAAGAPRMSAGGQSTATLRQAIAQHYRLL